MTIEIRDETAADRGAIRQVHLSAFGGVEEADLVDALRDGDFGAVSKVAIIDQQIVGHILFSEVCIVRDGQVAPALSLAPMAVIPDRQRQGIGSLLVQAGLDACRRRGDRVILVLGHPGFYSRFGFAADKARLLSSPFGGGEAWMALELVPDSLNSGEAARVEYSPPFNRFL